MPLLKSTLQPQLKSNLMHGREDADIKWDGNSADGINASLDYILQQNQQFAYRLEGGNEEK